MSQQKSIPKRRALILTLYLSYLVVIISQLMLPLSELLPIIKVVAMVLSGIALLILFQNKYFFKFSSNSDSSLDERQIHLKGLAFRQAYGIISCLFVGCLIYTALAIEHGLWLPNTFEDVNTLIWGILLLGLTLPSVIVSWQRKAAY